MKLSKVLVTVVMMITSYLPLDAVILVTIFLYLLVKYVSRNFDHWEKKNVFYIKPLPFFGNFYDISMFRATIGESFARFYNQAKEPFFGIFVFDKPHLIIRSPELIKAILVRDFQYFEDRNLAKSHDAIVANMLFTNKNPDWKETRIKMTPVFTTGKLKNMIPLVNDVGENLKKYIDQLLPHFSVEAKEICAKYSTDVIAICAFGIKAKCFQNENAEFRKVGKMIFDFKWKVAIQQTSYFFLPALVKLFKMNFIDPQATQFLRETFWHTLKLRQSQNVRSNDVIGTIMEMTKNKEFCDKLNFGKCHTIFGNVQYPKKLRKVSIIL